MEEMICNMVSNMILLQQVMNYEKSETKKIKLCNP